MSETCVQVISVILVKGLAIRCVVSGTCRNKCYGECQKRFSLLRKGPNISRTSIICNHTKACSIIVCKANKTCVKHMKHVTCIPSLIVQTVKHIELRVLITYCSYKKGTTILEDISDGRCVAHGDSSEPNP